MDNLKQATEDVEKFRKDMASHAQSLRGAATEEVTLHDGKKIPTLRKVLSDAYQFIPAGEYQAGRRYFFKNLVTKTVGGVVASYLWLADDVVSSTFEQDLTAGRLSPLQDSGLKTQTVADKAALKILPANASKVATVLSKDGGLFEYQFGKPAGTFKEDGGDFCGTVILPSGGDGSAAWVRTPSDFVNVVWFGAKATFVGADKTHNNSVIQSVVNSVAAQHTVQIPKGVAWDYYSLSMPDDFQIRDYSTYDERNDQWGAQLKFYLSTANPGTKNANEFVIAGPYHPALIIDNTGDGAVERRCSIVFREKGAGDWQIGPGALNGDRNYKIAAYGSYAGKNVGGTLVLEIDKATGEFGFNGRKPGSAVSFNRLTPGTFVITASAKSGSSYERQFFSGNSLVYREQIAADGSKKEIIGGKSFLHVSSAGEVSSYKRSVLQVQSIKPLTYQDSGCVISNSESVGGFMVNLPAAEVGMTFEVRLDKTNNMRVQPKPTDLLKGRQMDGGSWLQLPAGKFMESSDMGAYCQVVCLKVGEWSFLRLGTWTDET